MTKVIDEAIQQIKEAGFSHVKVELEADIGRDGERECYDCDGRGMMTCDECGGEGAVETEEYVGQGYHHNWVECSDCYGDGERECNECAGTGNTGDFTSEETCESFMRDHVSEGARERLVYGRFYEDGSVDSEFTFTVRIEDYKDVIEWIDAFKTLGHEVGNGLDVAGAGMHVSVLTSGEYPSYETLDHAKLRNFNRQVSKLLPALFFMASAGHQSRDLGYRKPQISNDDKYSAIYTHDSTCLEYRLFETCYDKPETFFDYLVVIANTLKYYNDPTLQVKQLGKEFVFNDGNECARFFSTPESLRVLNAQIKELKPKNKTFKRLKQERGVHYTVKGLEMEQKQRMERLKADYQQYRKHYEEQLKKPLNEYEQEQVDWMMTREQLGRDRAIAMVRNLSSSVITLSDFVRDNYRSARRSYNSQVVTV